MARPDDRGGRDAAGAGPYHRPESALVSLRELADWELGDGEPDIRGWEVRTVSGRVIGNVRDLLIDREAGEVVLLDIDLDGSEGRARAPIRAAQIDRAARVVRMDSADLIGGAAVLATRADAVEGAPERVVEREPAVGDARETRTELLADGSVEETVVERRPVVYEEVVVRRRTVDPADDDLAPERPRTDGLAD